MKIIARLFTAVFAVTLIIGLSGFNLADNNGAGITVNEGCSLFDGYGVLVPANADQSVSNHGGNVTLICKAYGVATPGERYNIQGFNCNILDAFGTWHNTTNSFANVSVRLNRCGWKMVTILFLSRERAAAKVALTSVG